LEFFITRPLACPSYIRDPTQSQVCRARFWANTPWREQKKFYNIYIIKIKVSAQGCVQNMDE
jgi:hypothetical protein